MFENLNIIQKLSLQDAVSDRLVKCKIELKNFAESEYVASLTESQKQIINENLNSEIAALSEMLDELKK